MRVAVIGSGYVGLVSGTCLADFGHLVTCVDRDADKVASLMRNEIPIYEPGLKELVQTNVRDGRLSFTTSMRRGGAGGGCRSDRGRDAVAPRRWRDRSVLRLSRRSAKWRLR